MDISTEQTTSTGKGCLFLFGLVFFLVGLGMGLANLRGISQSIAAKNWTPTEVMILDANLKTSRGDESDTYTAIGRFQYEWNGQTIVSDRIYFSRSSDSDRKFHNGVVREMRANKSRQKPMIAYVNPKKPEQAVLYPKIRWNMVGFMSLFSLIFGGVGAGIMVAGHYVGRVIARENKRKILHPERPWLWKDAWQTSEIRSSGKASFYAILGFGVLWNLISLPLWFILPEEIIEKQNQLAAIGFLFPIVGLGFLYLIFKSYQRLKRFGDTRFVMDTFPAALGNILQGKLVYKKPLPLDSVFEVKLSAIYKYSTGSGDDRRTVEDIKWQDEQHIPLKVGRGIDINSLPIRFQLPKDQHPTAWDEGDREYIWRLSVKSEQGRIDFVYDFDVPVFDPATYNIRIPASAQMDDSAYESKIYTYEGDWRKTGVQAFEIPNGHAYFFKAARHKLMGAGLIFMVLIFGGIGVAPFFSEMSIIFSFFFGGFALLLGWFACTIWLFKTQIETAKGSLSVRSGMFNGTYKTIPTEDLDDIDMTSSMSSGNVKYYDIVAKTRSDEKIKLAVHLLGKRDVEALIRRIKSDLGMSVSEIN